MLGAKYYYEHYRKQRLIQRLYNSDTTKKQNRIFREIHDIRESYRLIFYDKDKRKIDFPETKDFDYNRVKYISIYWGESHHAAYMIKLKDQEILSILLGE